MFVKKIKWIDEDINEAEITLSDNQYDLLCFSDEFLGEIGDAFNDVLYALVEEDFVRSEEDIYLANHLDGFEYFLIAKIIDKAQNTVQLGEFKINIGGGIPQDLNNGDFIEIRVRRLDVY